MKHETAAAPLRRCDGCGRPAIMFAPGDEPAELGRPEREPQAWCLECARRAGWLRRQPEPARERQKHALAVRRR